MLKKIENNLLFSNKRDYKLITPCCKKLNKTGGFVNWKNIDSQFGYCNYCGITTLPPTIYEDDHGNRFIWNDDTKGFNSTSLLIKKPNNSCFQQTKESIKKSFINENIVWKHFDKAPENNLLKYLRKTYCNQSVNEVKEMYAIGTYNDSGTMFWTINKDLEVQKLKVAYYNLKGKRQNHFRVPFKNENGYHFCLFGEHLLIDKLKNKQKIVLVESEKTAVVGAIVLPKYTWLAYGGLNGLTRSKAEVLQGYKRVLVIPDFSYNALNTMKKKVIELKKIGVDIKIWDLTNGMSDEEKNNHGIYNDDLEDVIRNMESETYKNLINKIT